MKRIIIACLMTVSILFSNPGSVVLAENGTEEPEEIAETADENETPEEPAEEKEATDTVIADETEVRTEDTEIQEISEASETTHQEEAVQEEEITEENIENNEAGYQADQNGLSEAGNPYAVITDQKELIFFRSYNSYKDEARATVTDILGNKYTGFVYDCIKDGYMPWDYPSFWDRRPTSIFTAEGQVIRFPAEISLEFTFRALSDLKRVDFSRVLMENVTSLQSAFENCSKLTYADLSGLNTSKVTTMSSMFCGCSSLTNVDISSFNMRSVTDMWFMFYGCNNIKSINLGPQFTKWADSSYLPEGVWTHGKLNKTEKELYNQYPSNAQQWAGEWTYSPAPTSITINQGKSGELATGASMDLSVTFSPVNAFSGVKWSSDSAKIAFVHQSGKVFANSYGKTTITATSTVNNNLIAKFVIQTRFYDVTDQSQSYYKPVYWGADNGIVAGYDSGVYFGPDNNCTRAQFVTFLWRLAGRKEGKNDVTFPDLDPNANYYRAVKWAVSEGIIVGYKHDNGPATFEPEGIVTRAQVATMLWRFAGRPKVDTSGASPFKDINASNSAFRAVKWGQNAGVIKGYKDGTFQPDGNCLRQHIVTFLYRYARQILKWNVN